MNGRRRLDRPSHEELVPVLIRLPKEEHHALRVIAAKADMSMAEWVEKMVIYPALEKRAKELGIVIDEEMVK